MQKLQAAWNHHKRQRFAHLPPSLAQALAQAALFPDLRVSLPHIAQIHCNRTAGLELHDPHWYAIYTQRPEFLLQADLLPSDLDALPLCALHRQKRPSDPRQGHLSFGGMVGTPTRESTAFPAFLRLPDAIPSTPRLSIGTYPSQTAAAQAHFLLHTAAAAAIECGFRITLFEASFTNSGKPSHRRNNLRAQHRNNLEAYVRQNQQAQALGAHRGQTLLGHSACSFIDDYAHDSAYITYYNKRKKVWPEHIAQQYQPRRAEPQ
jgi:hypothetical protein